MTTTLDATAWAPDRATGVAFMEAVGIATTDADGNLVPLVPCMIYPARATEELTVVGVPGWHCNVRFYGDGALALQSATPDDPNYFNRSNILQLIDARTGIVPVWTALTNDVIPPGYQAPDGVRLYDPSSIKAPRNVWA